MIEITGSRERGQSITGWRDGRTQLRVWWRGADNPGPEAPWVEYMSVITGERQALITLGHIASFANLEVISAELERLGRVIACPRCDKALEERHGGPWCPGCGQNIPRAELERADKVNRVTQGLMDTVDGAVSDGLLPG